MTRLHEEEDGFTLIELMVVVMILAILIVMGLPTFIGVRARFQNRAAQSDLRNVVLAARILYTDNATFTSADAVRDGHRHDHPRDVLRANRSGIDLDEPRRSRVRQRQRHRVGQCGSSTATQFSAARMSASGTCFVILDGTTGTRYGTTGTAASCTATWAAANAAATSPAAAGW